MWPGRSLYFGPLQHLEPRLHGAPVLLVGLYRPFRIRINHGECISCRCAVVPAGVLHELELDGNVLAKLFVERDSPDFWAFRRRFPFPPNAFHAFDDPKLVELFLGIYEESPPKETIHAHIETLMPLDMEAYPLLHPRLISVLDSLRQEPEQNYSQFQMASKANLSTSRLLHLFKAEIGVPYRRYRIWKRLGIAIYTMSQTDCMMRSAMDAGFSDASHFSHCFRDFFGANPSYVFKRVSRFE